MFCELTQYPDGKWHCQHCNKPPLPVNAKRACADVVDITEAAERLGVVDRMEHYATALARWTRAGWPVRDELEVLRIFAECCEPCEDQERGHCRHCSCPVKPTGMAIRNKIRMATEKCPLGFW